MNNNLGAGNGPTLGTVHVPYILRSLPGALTIPGHLCWASASCLPAPPQPSPGVPCVKARGGMKRWSPPRRCNTCSLCDPVPCTCVRFLRSQGCRFRPTLPARLMKPILATPCLAKPSLTNPCLAFIAAGSGGVNCPPPWHPRIIPGFWRCFPLRLGAEFPHIPDGTRQPVLAGMGSRLLGLPESAGSKPAS